MYVGILAGLFLGLFALDAFSEGKPLAQALPDFIIHLVPGAVLLAVVALSWRWPWVWAAAFVGLALVYAASNTSRPDWIRLSQDRWRSSARCSSGAGTSRAASPPEVAPHFRGRRNIPRMVANIPRDG